MMGAERKSMVMSEKEAQYRVSRGWARHRRTRGAGA